MAKNIVGEKHLTCLLCKEKGNSVMEQQYNYCTCELVPTANPGLGGLLCRFVVVSTFISKASSSRLNIYYQEGKEVKSGGRV